MNFVFKIYLKFSTKTLYKSFKQTILYFRRKYFTYLIWILKHEFQGFKDTISAATKNKTNSNKFRVKTIAISFDEVVFTKRAMISI
ncbi:hypothetical protein AWQ22_13205 [Picosynechococcus sp. PCC 7117]|nr:hypothetical protein AWQ22_13205 [Picosynechococcus sp. PCC 7117]